MTSWTLSGFALVAASALAFTAAPGAAQHWNGTVEETAQGFRLGDPDAPLQLIEFVSYTCPHCAHFEEESEAELRYLYIHEGYAALEVRHLIRNIADVAAALVTECGETDQFFVNHRIMMHEQGNWLARARELAPSQQARWNSGTLASRMRAIASDLEFYEMMEPQGYTVAELDRCLSDEARADQIVAASGANAAEFNVQGTPSFVLNGTLLDGVHSWPQLSQVLLSERENMSTSTE
ncbi:DsbA family protein [Aurantiacibacter sediminis]|uniref:Thioredoxin domain-containing protein n=1 Tax=Aurantiacibacter sediminis TaxID=2793064 RepID=A0ABS0N2C7_9SPHN|nr:thioredoxin domain-containing protein [Aurantiacibacter sediminis]MBH5322118.1 thioredoxin domain-containing protein [Aurantiacibacter sediminis]